MRTFSQFVLASCLIANTYASTPSNPVTVPVAMSGGSDESDYDTLCEKVKCKVLEKANKSVSRLWADSVRMRIHV